MEKTIELKEILALVDNNLKSAWDTLSDEDKKIIKKDFFILNRWVSSISTNNRDLAEHYILTVNEFYNKHWFILQKNHSQLLWQLLCMCGHESKQVFKHQWISNKKGSSKVMNFLEKIYPMMKVADLEVLESTMSIQELKQLAKDHGYEDKQIKKMF